MKKIYSLILGAVITLLLFTSCDSSKGGEDLLRYQRMPMTVQASLTTEQGDAMITMVITDSENYAVTYSAPAAMKGVSYELQQNKPYLCFGETRVPITEGEACFGSLALARFFLLDYSMLTSSAPDTVDGKSVVKQIYNGDALHAAVLLSEEGQPIQISGESNGFSADLTEIQITYDN